MSFFISNAYAEAAPPAGGGLEFLIMIGIFFVIMYFMIIRPQQKRVKDHKALLDGLKKGDEIVTNGGLLGKVTEMGENFVSIEVSENAEVQVQKQAVASVMPKGTMKKN